VTPNQGIAAAPLADWAVVDSNTPAIITEKPQVADTGAVKSAAFEGDSFAQAVAAVMRLPLSESEKAEAVRRLLADRGQGKKP
jgi:hypothetical protein